MSRPIEADGGTGHLKPIYQTYIDILNEREFDRLPEVVNLTVYREICVGFTPGWIAYDASLASFKKLLNGVPNLTARLEDCVEEDNKIYARLKVAGTHRGSLFGIPATGRTFEVQMFDYVAIRDGKIIERIQQSDTLGMMGKLLGRPLLWAGLALTLLILSLLALVIWLALRP